MGNRRSHLFTKGPLPFENNDNNKHHGTQTCILSLCWTIPHPCLKGVLPLSHGGNDLPGAGFVYLKASAYPCPHCISHHVQLCLLT